MKYPVAFILLFVFGYSVFAQKRAISFETNGRSQEQTSQNPFQKFIGEWTLKDDNWTQNWGNETETIKIENHHTVTQDLNTTNTLLSIIDGPEPNGQIFWSYNPITKQVFHLSSFGSIRAGKGEGTVNENGDVHLKISFEGEAKGTYRIYDYKWINDNEYHMKSVQYDEDDVATGLYYEGYFIRLKTDSLESVKGEIKTILAVLDSNEISIDEQLKVYANDVVHMAPDSEVINGKLELKTYLLKQREYGTAEMNHQIVRVEVLGDKVLMRGQVEGKYYPSNEAVSIQFKTKILFVFSRIKGNLKIEKIIYNQSPLD